MPPVIEVYSPKFSRWGKFFIEPRTSSSSKEEVMFLALSFKIQYFEWKSSILVGEMGQLSGANILLTIRSHKSIFQLLFLSIATQTRQHNP